MRERRRKRGGEREKYRQRESLCVFACVRACVRECILGSPFEHRCGKYNKADSQQVGLISLTHYQDSCHEDVETAPMA